MRIAWAAALVALAAAPAGCGGEPPRGEGRAGDQGEVAARDERVRRQEERVVLGWTRAVRTGDFERAGAYFSEGAVVEQGIEFRLDTHQDAVAFSRELPCRARVTDLEREDEGVLVAEFDLSEGADGECAEGGTAAVRFVIRAGAIEEWRQLPPAPPPEGDIA